MDDVRAVNQAEATQPESAFVFEGNWREFAPIVFTNLLLMIATLGIYRFWATTRERQYLWSRTSFIGEPLEWTGTGKELFLGFLIVLILFGLPLFILQFGVQALVLRGYVSLAGWLTLASFAVILYFTGVALFRALRYRLGRTYWHGIRGGSDDTGLRYGVSYVGRRIVGGLSLGLLTPWVMVSLWNERWRRMSFGPLVFESSARSQNLLPLFLLFYLIPAILLLMFLAVAISLSIPIGFIIPYADAPLALRLVMLAVILVGGVLLIGAIYLTYFSAFLRETIGCLRLGDLEFAFTASFEDWFRYLLGNLLLVVVTLGVGVLFLPYRKWAFIVTHLEAYGEVSLATLSQSTTHQSRHGEGLLDALDVGAI